MAIRHKLWRIHRKQLFGINRFLNEAIDEEIRILEEENKYGIDIEKLKSMKTAVIISSQSTNERPQY